MKTKKNGVLAALTAILLVSALLLTACMETFSPTNTGLNLPPAPEGMGYLILNVNDSGAKTVLPVKPDTIVYEVIIEDVSDNTILDLTLVGGNVGGVNPDFNGNTEIYLLPEGDYDVIVNARDGSASGAIFATGSDSVDLNLSDATATIALEPAKTTGSGTFAWNFASFPTNQTGRTLTFTKIGGGSVPTVTTVNTTGNTPIDAGQYRVTLTFVNSDGEHFDLVFEDIVHIWAGMTSTWRRTTAFPPLSKSIHTITYNLNSGGWDNEPTNLNTVTTTGGTQKVAHFDYAIEPDEEPIRAGYDFDGWNTTASDLPVAGTPWTFAPIFAETILADRTLFARWDYTGTQYNLTINITMFTDLTDLKAEGDSTTDVYLSAIHSGAANAVIVSVTKPAGVTMTALWLGGVDLSLTSAVTLDNSGDQVIIDFTDSAIKSTSLMYQNTHELLLEAEDASNNKYGGIITFNVINDQ